MKQSIHGRPAPADRAVAATNGSHAERGDVVSVDRHDLLGVLIDHLPDVVFIKDDRSRFVRINRACADLWGLADPAEAEGKSDYDLAPADVAHGFVADDRRIFATGEAVIDRLEPATDHDGTPRWLLTSKVPINDDDGRVTGLFGIARDVTARLAAEEALRESEERFRGAFDAAAIGMCLVAPAGRFLRVNRALCEIVGYTEQEMLARTFQETTHADDLDRLLALVHQTLAGTTPSFRMEKRCLHRDGHAVWVQLAVSLVRDAEGAPLHLVGQVQDVSERKALEESLRHLAYHDPLTGLPNRARLMDVLQAALAHANAGAAVAVLFLDLDRFKVVNDSLGHAAGDRFLCHVVDRLKTSLRPADVLARFGGDEFAVVLTGIATTAQATMIADRLRDSLQAPFLVEGREVFVGGSIGIALRDEPGSDAGELLREADVALYRAKAAGRGRCAVFDPAANAAAMQILARESDLRRAIERQEFELHYQPVVDLADGAIVGFEALIRWRHPIDGLLLPADFLPLAEETGLIVPIGNWALVEACRSAQRWRDLRPDQPVVVAVNVSPRQFRDPGFGPLLWRALAAEGLAPSLLKLEVTEDALGEDADATTTFLHSLRGVGVKLALDDFGAGYSSLGRIHQLPLDAIKIDRSFVAGLGVDPDARAIVRAVAGLAADLGLSLTAEGIETADQVRILRKTGCACGQGFFFSTAVTAAEAERQIVEGARARPVSSAV